MLKHYENGKKRKMLRFYGNEIYCGSYACLNAMENNDIDIRLFEISTSTPFGIRHMENSYFDHLLTPYCNPNQGLDGAIKMWGYDTSVYSVSTSEEIISLLKMHIWENSAVLGPLDMGKIGYLVVPELLRRMDHYITLRVWDENSVLCVDSEGVNGYRMTYQELGRYISVKEVLEAEGKIRLRFVHKTGDYSCRTIIESSFNQAYKNILDAEKEGNGPKAIWQCFEYIKQYDMYLWKLPLLYDFEYLLQRKNLFRLLIEKGREYCIEKEEYLDKMDITVMKQQMILGQMYKRLKYSETIDEADFMALAVREAELRQCIMNRG